MKLKQRWWIKTLLKNYMGPTLLANHDMEDGSGFEILQE
jgi:hypothetical protein